MTTGWSQDNLVCEFKDLQASCMSVSSRGQHVLLAGRRVLAVVDLSDKPVESVKRYPRQSKWDVNALEWNPHDSHSNYFVLASSQRADIYSWDEGVYTLKAALKAHTRVISDLDWCPADGNTIATCSVDTYTYVWDLRETRKPAAALQAVAGMSQVKWNKLSTDILATAHDGDIRIWDRRKGTVPVQYIAGHLSKIHGLDWSPHDEHHLATSSQDCTVKFWDINKPKHSEDKLQSQAPVWRARYTPFGKGLITVMVPQLRRGDNALCLWCLNDLRHEVDIFSGHRDVVLEFQWRHRDPSCANFELVTWGRDHSLRIWPIDPNLQKLCGHDVPEELLKNTSAESTQSEATLTMTITETTLADGSVTAAQDQQAISINGKEDGPTSSQQQLDVPRTPPNHSKRPQELHSPQQPRSLYHEFRLVNRDIPNVTVHEMDDQDRTCMVSAVSGSHIVSLTMTFPLGYPFASAPTFTIGEESSISKTAQDKLLKNLSDRASQQVQSNKLCLEPCLWQLYHSLEGLAKEETSTTNKDTFFQLHVNQFPLYYAPNYTDNTIPFPRTSGARFCGAGYLVCFTRRAEGSTRRISSTADITPRAMTALGGGLMQGALTPQSSSGYNLNLFTMASSPQNDPPYTYYDDFGPSFADVIPLGNRGSMASNRSTSGYSMYGRSPPVPGDGTALTNFYNSLERKPKRSRNRRRDPKEDKDKPRASSPKKTHKTGPVIIYDISSLMPPSRELAEKYVIDSCDIVSMCTKNAAAAEVVGRRDLMQTWSLAGLLSSRVLQPRSDPDDGQPWAKHVFGRKMVTSLFEHYSRIHDVQSLAMLCCVFGSKQPLAERQTSSSPKSSEANMSPNYNAYHTVHPTDTSLKGWTYMVQKIRRSNSLSELDLNRSFGEETKDPLEVEREEHASNIKLLDPARSARYDCYLTAYGDLLYRWELQDKRAEVLQYISNNPDRHCGIEFVTRCHHCQTERRGPSCDTCKKVSLQCVVCHIAVRGSSTFCLACGHGGHSLHIVDWFSSHTHCPAGCGCSCLEENPMSAIK